MLKTATVETAKESERGIVDHRDAAAHQPEPDLDAGRGAADSDRGRARSGRQAEAELRKIEGELKQKLLEVRRGDSQA